MKFYMRQNKEKSHFIFKILENSTKLFAHYISYRAFLFENLYN